MSKSFDEFVKMQLLTKRKQIHGTLGLLPQINCSKDLLNFSHTFPRHHTPKTQTRRQCHKQILSKRKYIMLKQYTLMAENWSNDL